MVVQSGDGVTAAPRPAAGGAGSSPADRLQPRPGENGRIVPANADGKKGWQFTPIPDGKRGPAHFYTDKQTGLEAFALAAKDWREHLRTVRSAS